MKINSIQYTNIANNKNTYDIVEKNINILSSARLIMELEIHEDINYIPKYQIKGSYNNKWGINYYGVPKFLSNIKGKSRNIELNYFTISSNIANINDEDSIEYSGLQLGEIENSYFSKLLCYNSNIVYTSRNKNYSKNLSLFDEIEKQINIMIDLDLYPKYIICDSYSLLNILVDHSTFQTISSAYQPHTANINIDNETIYIIVNNMVGNDLYSNIYLCADLIGPMHIKGGLQHWENNNNNIIFTETIGMAVLEENGVKRFIIEK